VSGSGQTLFVRYGNFLFKDRKIIFPLVLVVLLFGFRPRQPAPGTGTGIDTALIGWLLAAIGEGIRVAVIGLAYIKRGGRNKRVYADVLVAEGIFHHCRNPLYLGNLLIVTGLFVIHSNPWVYLIGTMFFFTAYSAIVAAEESYLFGKFGKDYERY
jgi:protein-S-isoprenylcysteine O-methyltransferase Ste14